MHKLTLLNSKPKRQFFSTTICLSDETKDKLETLKSTEIGQSGNSKAIARALSIVDPRLDPMNARFNPELTRRYHALLSEFPK